MAGNDEQVELLVSSDAGAGHANSTVLSHASIHHGHKLIDFEAKYGRKADVSVTSFCDALLSRGRDLSCKCDRVLNFIERHVPVVNLIRTYKFRQDILGDIVSGLSVGVLTIPQSMGYALLASMPAKFGLYTSLFPVLVYFIFGTSRHVSMGTMALSSLFIHSAIARDVTESDGLNITSNGTAEMQDESESMKLTIAMSVSMTAGLIMFVMSLFQLGFIVTYMSDSFISGYIAAANILVLTHQLKLILGVKTTPRGSALELFFLVYDICRNILDTNLMQLLISVLSIIALLLVKQCINERFKSRLKVPIPIDLIVVAVATAVSYFGNLRQNYDVKVVNEIPYGIPAPVIPSLKVMYSYWFEGFMLAVISYFMVAMMAVLFAQRHNYSVDNNQELAANGLSCIVGAFFNSLAASTSPPRCFLMESTGGRTQVSYVVSAVLVLLTIYFIAPLFEALPLCVLASIVVVASVPLFVHYTMWRTYWQSDRYDFAIWLVSCCGTFLAGVDYGMIVGITFSVLAVHFRMQHSKSSKLALNADDFQFLDSGHYNKVTSLKGTVVFRFGSPVYFATVALFKKQLFASSISLAELKARQKLANKHKDVFDVVEITDGKASVKTDCGGNGKILNVQNVEENKKLKDQSNGLPEGQSDGECALISESVDSKDGSNMKQDELCDIKNIIVDCNVIPFVDTAGCRLLSQLHADYNKNGIKFVLAGCCDDVVSTLKRAEPCQTLCKESLYPSVQSAVLSLHCNLS